MDKIPDNQEAEEKTLKKTPDDIPTHSKKDEVFLSPQVKDDQKKKVPSQSDTAKPSSAEESSSSSNNKTSSSSGNTGGTVSSADTLPTGTQESVQEEIDEEPQGWAKLLPLNNAFYILNMIEDSYTFGRMKTCAYCFDIPSIKKNFKHFSSLSKTHFTISRVSDSSGCKNLVLLTDNSLNGVFVNGDLVGKKKTRHLIDKDEISLTQPNSKVFVFFNCSTDKDSTLPPSFSQKYIMHKLIGKGAFGEVREVFTKRGAGRFAAKIIEKKRISMYLSQHDERDILTEARLMLNLRHPCVISVHDIINAQSALFIILELAEGGELFERLITSGPMQMSTAKILFYQMLSAVSYLHDNNVTHRDLKPENILLTSHEEECIVKITDFGMSRVVGEESLMLTQAGTRSYLAPEIIRHIDGTGDGSGYTRMVDSWSLGVILYMCIAASPPFSGERRDTTDTLNQQILKGDFKFRSSVWNSADENVKDLISKLLVMDPQKRLSPAKALQHPWLQDDEMKDKVSSLWASETVAKRDPFAANPIELLHKLERSNSNKSESTTTTTSEGTKCSGRKRELSNSSNSTNGSLSPSETKKLKTSSS